MKPLIYAAIGAALLAAIWIGFRDDYAPCMTALPWLPCSVSGKDTHVR